MKEILLLQQPDEIFIPYKREPIAEDHSATNRIVISALQMCKRKTTTYEYPIWLYFCLPWVNVPMSNAKEVLSALKRSLISGLSLLKGFQRSIYIGDVLVLKRDLLDQYKSQMARLIPNPRWHTLGDLSNRDFLECFFKNMRFSVFRNIYLRESISTKGCKLKNPQNYGAYLGIDAPIFLNSRISRRIPSFRKFFEKEV